MHLLAVDTSTDACSAALWLAGEVHERREVAPRRHAALLLPMVASLLDEAGVTLARLDAIAFGRGPGSFTGVRIAAGVAQGLAFAAELPVLPVSTLAALAEGARRERGALRVLAALDARMDEVYLGAFEAAAGGMRAAAPERVCAPAEATAPAGAGWLGCGSGWSVHGATLAAALGARAPARVEPERLPAARDVAALAAAPQARPVPPEQAVPVYLRDRVTR